MSVRIDRVYTKSGDEGETSLIGGGRVSKADERICAYGTVDELNAVVGVCRSLIANMPGPKDLATEIGGHLEAIQQDLFNLGADLATPADFAQKKNVISKVTEARIDALEKAMDQWQVNLKPLQSFVLPGGGGGVGAHLHLARTVCRRAEREVVALGKNQKLIGPALRYLNRLSDYFFVCSRYVASRLGETEFLWRY